MKWKVDSAESGIKLIAFLQKKLGDQFSARKLKHFVEKNLCTVNGRVERFASITVGRGDEIELSIENFQEKPSKSFANTIEILYEDNTLLIYNKPAGIVCENENFLFLNKGKLALVHRLDRDTTGALIFAKTQQAFDAMTELFRNRLVNKQYLAIVDSVPKEKQGTIDNYIGEIHHYQGQTIWGKVNKNKGLHAITTWKCEKQANDAALLLCMPKTGRTHQLRVHLNSMGHPILGDFQYCRKFHCAYNADRCMLHAWKVSFPHPFEKKMIDVAAPLPEDLKKAIVKLFGSYEDINH